MKITKIMSFGVMVLSLLMAGFYTQNQIGNKNSVDNFFANLSTKSREIIETNFPKDLVINVNKGQVTTNQKLPYCLLVDKEKNEGIVFDSAENPNIKSFETQPKNFSCKPMAVVGKDYVVYRSDTETKIWNVPSEVSVTIDQKMLLENKDKYLPVVENKGRKLYAVLPLILVIIAIPWVMLFNFWYSWILGIIIKLSHVTQGVETKNKYWITLFFGSILSIINHTLLYFGYRQISFAFSGTIIITVASILYLKYFSNQIIEDEVVVEPKVKKIIKKKK